MSVWDICIRRPIFTVMLVSAPIVLGIAAYQRLGVDLFPNVDLPVVTITTTLRGASVEEMETQVTKPIEEIVNTISSIDELRSTTSEGLSQVTVQFLLEKDGDVAAVDRLGAAAGVLAVRFGQGQQLQIRAAAQAVVDLQAGGALVAINENEGWIGHARDS